jgi:hypothetical protein
MGVAAACGLAVALTLTARNHGQTPLADRTLRAGDLAGFTVVEDSQLTHDASEWGTRIENPLTYRSTRRQLGFIAAARRSLIVPGHADRRATSDVVEFRSDADARAYLRQAARTRSWPGSSVQAYCLLAIPGGYQFIKYSPSGALRTVLFQRGPYVYTISLLTPTAPTHQATARQLIAAAAALSRRVDS